MHGAKYTVKETIPKKEVEVIPPQVVKKVRRRPSKTTV
jgi:hypothetical protein